MAAHSTLNLHEIAVFIAAAQSASFSQAARRLHISQPAVSQAIHSLERQFGASLFDRHNRAGWLTPAGEALLPAARELDSASQVVIETMNHVDGLVAGELAVGCATTAGKYVLPGLLAAFQTQYPQVHVRLEVRNNEDVLAGLLGGELALGLMSQVSPLPALEYQPFFEDRIILIVPAGHAWASFGRALPADLIDQPLIMQEPDSGTRAAVLEALAHHAISGEMLHVVMQVSNAEAIETAVEEASGAAFISELAAEHGLALGRIKRVEVEGMPVLRQLYLVRDTDWPLTRAQTLFWRHFGRNLLAPDSMPQPAARPTGTQTL